MQADGKSERRSERKTDKQTDGREEERKKEIRRGIKDVRDSAVHPGITTGSCFPSVALTSVLTQNLLLINYSSNVLRAMYRTSANKPRPPVGGDASSGHVD